MTGTLAEAANIAKAETIAKAERMAEAGPIAEAEPLATAEPVAAGETMAAAEALVQATVAGPTGMASNVAVEAAFEVVVGMLLIVSAFFVLSAAVGVVRFPDFYSRANVATVATTQGLLGVAMATTLFFSVRDGSLYLKDLLVFLFVFLTVPAGTHLMAKTAYYLGVPMPRQAVVDELRKALTQAPRRLPDAAAASTPEASEGLGLRIDPPA